MGLTVTALEHTVRTKVTSADMAYVTSPVFTYRKLHTIQESGLLDLSILEIWLNKQYDDAAHIPLNNDNPDLGV